MNALLHVHNVTYDCTLCGAGMDFLTAADRRQIEGGNLLQLLEEAAGGGQSSAGSGSREARGAGL